MANHRTARGVAPTVRIPECRCPRGQGCREANAPLTEEYNTFTTHCNDPFRRWLDLYGREPHYIEAKDNESRSDNGVLA
ncbi:MAG: hypothetical protein IPM83_05090 [Ignavibacteria bacterium]|nr:hypothetical protein [Ignavibacteria bacterium]